MSEKINEVLRQRKAKNKQLAHYRKQRIVNRYRNISDEKPQEVEQQDQGTKRQRAFYQQVFEPKQQEKKQERKVKTETNQPNQQHMQQQKNRQKKLIKKMKSEKTRNGQPLMKNYIKYALNKIEMTIKNEKIQKKNEQKNVKSQDSRPNKQKQGHQGPRHQ